jgi:RNA polymerase sigma factor (sigma-70 family)
MWDSAFQSLWPIAYRAAWRHLKKSFPSDVEDIAIISIGEVREKIKQVSSFAKLEALTAVIARRNAFDHLRRMEAIRRGGGKIESIEGYDPPAPDDPLASIDALDMARLLSELMGKLSKQHCKVLKAYYLDGMKQTQLAALFPMPIGTVGTTLRRAIEQLREELAGNPKLMKELRELLK